MKSTERQTYNIPFRQLSEGIHKFEFKLTDSFFKEYEALSDYTGTIVVDVQFLKKDSKQQIFVDMKGELDTICDRCLDPLKIEFDGDGKYYLKEAEEGEREDENVIFVELDANKVELSQLFYELVVVNLPQIKMHEEGNCNEEMLEKLEALKIKNEDKIDPRWEALKKLTKKEK